MLAFHFIASVESEKQDIHDHEFARTEYPLTVPVVVHVSQMSVRIITSACKMQASNCGSRYKMKIIRIYARKLQEIGTIP